MALIFCDGFDHYASADFTRKWTTRGSDWTIASGGRFGSNCAHNNSQANSTLVKQLPSNYATLIVGFAFKLAAGDVQVIVSLRDNGSEHVSLRTTAGGLIGVYRNGTLLANTSASVTGVYIYIEFKTTINNSTGSWEARVNGVSVGSATNVDTQNGANAFVNQVVFGVTGNATTHDIDDLYVCDTSGSTNNTFLGDCRIETLRPSGAGNSTQFTPSTGANNAAVDETTPNTTDYVTSTADNQIDTYAFGDLASSGVTVYGVQTWVYAQKTDASAKSVAIVTRPGSTNNVGGDQALTTDFAYYSEIRETNPDTAAAWTTSEINATEWGVKSRP